MKCYNFSKFNGMTNFVGLKNIKIRVFYWICFNKAIHKYVINLFYFKLPILITELNKNQNVEIYPSDNEWYSVKKVLQYYLNIWMALSTYFFI